MLAFGLAATPLTAQQTTEDLLRLAGFQVDAHKLDSAGVLLRAALAAARDSAERAEALFWTAAVEFLSGRDSAARASARAAFQLRSMMSLRDPDQIAPGFGALLTAEAEAVRMSRAIFTINAVEVKPQRLTGPTVVYPRGPWVRQVAGRAIIEGVVDTAGRFEPASIEIVEAPDSELVGPVRTAMLASRFSAGRLKGKPVRTLIRLGIELHPPSPPNPTVLANEARARLAAGDPDSALSLVDFALEPVVGAPPGARAYATIVRGIALMRARRDSAGRAALDSGLAAYTALLRGGVDLSPTFHRLADSVQSARRRRSSP